MKNYIKSKLIECMKLIANNKSYTLMQNAPDWSNHQITINDNKYSIFINKEKLTFRIIKYDNTGNRQESAVNLIDSRYLYFSNFVNEVMDAVVSYSQTPYSYGDYIFEKMYNTLSDLDMKFGSKDVYEMYSNEITTLIRSNRDFVLTFDNNTIMENIGTVWFTHKIQYDGDAKIHEFMFYTIKRNITEFILSVISRPVYDSKGISNYMYTTKPALQNYLSTSISTTTSEEVDKVIKGVRDYLIDEFLLDDSIKFYLIETK